MVATTYRVSGASDLGAIRDLLEVCALPTADLSANLHQFIVAEQDGQIVATVGLETFGRDALLRSLGVRPEFRRLGLASALCSRMLSHAGNQGVSVLHLLTTTAEDYFAKIGFSSCDREALPEAIRSTEEFRRLCPSTAICMRKDLSALVRYFPHELLQLRPDVPGSQMWGVALEQAMLTYFEVEPNCRFERHVHAGEQITMVLEGALFFETDAGEVAVRAGEVIAIPAGAPHAVFTRDDRARAVDAWSPPLTKYARPGT